jgi:hypothetical protein
VLALTRSLLRAAQVPKVERLRQELADLIERNVRAG